MSAFSLGGGRRRLLGALLVAVPLSVAQKTFEFPSREECPYCNLGESLGEFLTPPSRDTTGIHSDVHALWSTHVEVIPITTENGGFEPPSFHQNLADAAIAGWKRFRDEIGPGLPRGHFLRSFVEGKRHAGSLNDGFFHFQKRLFEAEGRLQDALDDKRVQIPALTANTSWPEMNALPEYRRLRKIVDVLSKRYLIRSGVDAAQVKALNYSIFNWAAINSPGEFHGPHTHVGEYHVGVFYAQAGASAGKLRFGDPRGHSAPFGRQYMHTPRAGDLVFFPSWLSHMATVTSPSAASVLGAQEEPNRVIFSFNIGPWIGPLPCHYWWSDPTAEMGFTRHSPLDPKALGL